MDPITGVTAASLAPGFGQAVGGIGLDVIGKGIDFAFGQAAAKQQQSAAKEMYRKRWRWAVSDMTKAGINPILATKAGPGASPSMALGSTGGPTQLGATSARLAQAAESRGRTKISGMQQMLDEAQIGVALAQADAARSAGMSSRAQAEKSAAEARRIDATMESIPAEHELRRNIFDAVGDAWYKLDETASEYLGENWLEYTLAFAAGRRLGLLRGIPGMARIPGFAALMRILERAPRKVRGTTLIRRGNAPTTGSYQTNPRPTLDTREVGR
jgi:hypothetical protein